MGLWQRLKDALFGGGPPAPAGETPPDSTGGADAPEEPPEYDRPPRRLIDLAPPPPAAPAPPRPPPPERSAAQAVALWQLLADRAGKGRTLSRGYLPRVLPPELRGMDLDWSLACVAFVCEDRGLPSLPAFVGGMEWTREGRQISRNSAKGEKESDRVRAHAWAGEAVPPEAELRAAYEKRSPAVAEGEEEWDLLLYEARWLPGSRAAHKAFAFDLEAGETLVARITAERPVHVLAGPESAYRSWNRNETAEVDVDAPAHQRGEVRLVADESESHAVWIENPDPKSPVAVQLTVAIWGRAQDDDEKEEGVLIGVGRDDDEEDDELEEEGPEEEDDDDDDDLV